VLSGFAMAMNDWLLWYPGADTSFIVIYTISAMISGAVIAGWGSWALMRGLAKTGALVRFESGREVTGAV
jgi:energy-coupling factor transport system permease protein